MPTVLESLITAASTGSACIYTALVETRGSTPQKAGASMLVYPDGSQVGTLGGGCIEAEVKRRAIALLDTGSTSTASAGSSELMTFQLDSDYGWDDGLICGGRMKMIVDPVRPGSDLTFYQKAHELVSTGAGLTEAVLLDAVDGQAAGSRFLFSSQGDLVASRGGLTPPAPVRESLKPLSARPRPYVAGPVSYLTTLPRCRLLIVGGGHVGQKTAALAHEVDFDVWIIDDREEYCTEDRFPTASRRLSGPLGRTLKGLETTDNDFGIIVTRGHSHDEEALYKLITKPFRYLGMIGSKRKIRLIFDDLRKEGISEERLQWVHAPLGLEIGSQTVPEIAVSIVAELIAVRNRGEFHSTIHKMRDTVSASRTSSRPTGAPQDSGQTCSG